MLGTFLKKLKTSFSSSERTAKERAKRKTPTTLEYVEKPKRITDIASLTELQQCAAQGDIEGLRALIRAGINLDETDTMGRTALHYAAEEGLVEAMRDLIRAGIDQNIRDNTRQTAMDHAEKFGRLTEYNEAAYQAKQMKEGHGYYGWLAEQIPVTPLNKTITE